MILYTVGSPIPIRVLEYQAYEYIGLQNALANEPLIDHLRDNISATEILASIKDLELIPIFIDKAKAVKYAESKIIFKRRLEYHSSVPDKVPAVFTIRTTINPETFYQPEEVALFIHRKEILLILSANLADDIYHFRPIKDKKFDLELQKLNAGKISYPSILLEIISLYKPFLGIPKQISTLKKEINNPELSPNYLYKSIVQAEEQLRSSKYKKAASMLTVAKIALNMHGFFVAALCSMNNLPTDINNLIAEYCLLSKK
jgi:hypothetical protein